MKHYLQKRRAQGDGGFTLIELLIVIVILGILAAIVVFSTRGVTDRGQASACRSTISSVLTAAEAARAQTGAYPTNAAGLQNFLTLPTGVTTANDTPAAGQVTITGNGWTVVYNSTVNPVTATGTLTGGGAC